MTSSVRGGQDKRSAAAEKARVADSDIATVKEKASPEPVLPTPQPEPQTKITAADLEVNNNERESGNPDNSERPDVKRGDGLRADRPMAEGRGDSGSGDYAGDSEPTRE